jgi:hypothetical protein
VPERQLGYHTALRATVLAYTYNGNIAPDTTAIIIMPDTLLLRSGNFRAALVKIIGKVLELQSLQVPDRHRASLKNALIELISI